MHSTVDDKHWLHLSVYLHRECLSRAVTHVRVLTAVYAFCLLLPL